MRVDMRGAGIAKDETFEQRVGCQTVRTMQAGLGDFTRRIKPRRVGAPVGALPVADGVVIGLSVIVEISNAQSRNTIHSQSTTHTRTQHTHAHTHT